MNDSPAEEFDQLMRGHIRSLYRYAYRWTGDVDQAEDLVQETLTRLYSEMPRLREIQAPRSWAARIMYRIFVDWLRRARRSPVLFQDNEEIDTPDESLDPALLAEQALQQEQVLEAWGRLHEQHRVVLSLFEIEGYSLEEVASIIEVPLGTTKSRLHRARQSLRELLGVERG
jgi:RNA polymerase sigma-70 factor (ECF subfamily)